MGMYVKFLILIMGCLISGIFCNFILFRQEKRNEKSSKFLTSERFLVFTIEILVAVIGFGFTLTITNDNERMIEKEKAIQMIEQTLEFTDNQLKRERSYLATYKKGDINTSKVVNSNVINLKYYENILSNELILQNVNMNTYGEIMKYLVWIEHCNERIADELNDEAIKSSTFNEKIYSEMYYRNKHLKNIQDILSICQREMSGEISEEEANSECYNIRYDISSEFQD